MDAANMARAPIFQRRSPRPIETSARLIRYWDARRARRIVLYRCVNFFHICTSPSWPQRRWDMATYLLERWQRRGLSSFIIWSRSHSWSS